MRITLDLLIPGMPILIGRHSGHTSVNGFQKEHATAMLLIQCNPPVPFPDICGENHLCIAFEGLTAAPDHPIVTVCGFFITTAFDLLPSGECVSFVTTVFYRGLDVFKEKLEAMYPDWERQWMMGSELGIDEQDLYRHVFEHRSSFVVDTPFSANDIV